MRAMRGATAMKPSHASAIRCPKPAAPQSPTRFWLRPGAKKPCRSGPGKAAASASASQCDLPTMIDTFSASSKTAIGLGFALAQRAGPRPVSIGLTSKANVAALAAQGIYDRVIAYDDIATLDAATPSAFVDMASFVSGSALWAEGGNAAVKL